MEPEQKTNGALVGSIIIIVILVLGGIYLLKNSIREAPAPEPESSDVYSEIETELNTMDLETLDEEI